MKEFDQTFLSSDKKTAVRYISCEPEGEIKGVVQIAHGMAEHIDRYGEFMAFLCQNGYVACGCDHLGHGKTSPNDLGYIARKNGWQNLRDDQILLTRLMKKRYENLPFILFGHSMGSFVARACVSEYGSEYDRAVFCGTAGKNPAAGAGLALVALLRLFKGERYRSAFIKNMSFSGYNSRYSDVQTDLDWLSTDRETVKAYAADPHCGFTFTLSAYRDLMTLISLINTKKCVQSSPKSLPLLFVSGKEDPVGGFGSGVEQAANLYKTAGSQQVSVKLYDGCRHEILNDSCRHEAMQDILKFINS